MLKKSARRELPLTTRLLDELVEDEFLPVPFLTEEINEAPRLMMTEKGHDLVVHADIPGMRKDEISVTADGGMLTICGEHSERSEKGKARNHGKSYDGCFTESFSESVSLPAGVKAESMRASFKDGVLEIRMPRVGNGKVHKVTVH